MNVSCLVSRACIFDIAPIVFLVVVVGMAVGGCQSRSDYVDEQSAPPVDSIYGDDTSYETDVPYVATPQRVVERMLDLAGVGEDDVVYDLGSGDGRIVMTAVQEYGARRGVGIEIVPELVEQSRSYARLAGVSDRVSFYRADLFDTDLGEATVLTMYLLPEVIEKLIPKIRRELDPGDRVVSHNYGADLWPPDRTERVSEGHVVYLWTIRDSTSASTSTSASDSRNAAAPSADQEPSADSP